MIRSNLAPSRLAKISAALGMATLLALASTACLPNAYASITKVGNGDDGGDLEGGTKVTSGILIETRNKALERIRTLNVQAVEHLGTLIPELEKSEIFFVSREIAPKLNEDKGPEGSADGKSVYARTFAEPHAATRFFPSALMLNEEQLIALHIHEALHRSLPPAVRESEEIVSKITLSIASPDASIDRIRKVVASEVPSTTILPTVVNASPTGTTEVRTANGPITIVMAPPPAMSSEAKISVPEPRLENPSSVTYSYRSFFIPKKEKSTYPIESLHSVQSFLYPFGTGSHALGVGVELAYLTTPEQSFVGPVTLSARMRLLSTRDFDVGLWGSIALNTIASDELKESSLGRDVTTIGLSLRRDARNFYVENLISVGGQGEAKQRVGKVDYTHQYGALTSASVRAGAKLRGFEFGGFTEVILSESYKVRGGEFPFDSGRYRIISAGPEFAYVKDALRIAASARWVIDSTKGVSLDYLGDLMGRGVGQGYVNTSAALSF